MIIKVKTTPTNEELLSLLRKELPSDYSLREFGLDKKTVMIKKSAFIGAQVTVRKNEIAIDESTPSVVGGILSSLAMIELASLIVFIFACGATTRAKFQAFEREMAALIFKLYN
ncbi:hypothetical protein [Algoriphagus litoralis]|uniref:hypothetical protein n=1 Tax=Algoriphagus litoralis TaxID=2202829 RepID=UPI000DBA52F6|nr:hypothetical protein [Algoriphagus litoralis]